MTSLPARFVAGQLDCATLAPSGSGGTITALDYKRNNLDLDGKPDDLITIDSHLWGLYCHAGSWLGW